MEETISVTEFKAKCLDIMKRIGRRQLERVTVTRHGEAVAVITPPPRPAAGESLRELHGFMKGKTIIPEGFDLTSPTSDEAEFDAARGVIHR